MRYLILVRPGDHEPGGLSPRGQEQIRKLSEEFAHMVIGKPMILTSPAPPANDSAQMLLFFFDGKVQEDKLLYSSADTNLNLPGAMKLVRQYEGAAETIIVVTHEEYLNSFPAYFFNAEFEMGATYPFIKEGEALAISRTHKSITHVQPGE